MRILAGIALAGLLGGAGMGWSAEEAAPAAPAAAKKKTGKALEKKNPSAYSAANAVPATAPAELVPLPEMTRASKTLKDIPVGPAKVSFGLAHRTRVEVWDNRFLPGNRSYTNGLTFSRTRLWMDWNLHKHVRVFVMGQDARKDGDRRFRGRFWEDKPDLLEGYVDFRNLFGQNLTLRVGRQALRYGRERLVGAFEWSNPGRRFDALKLIWKSPDKQWSADAFASKVVMIDPEGFDEQHPTEEFYGLYATNHSLRKHRFDLYTLARMNENGKIADELGRRGQLRVYTHGFRAYGSKFFGGLDYEVEAAFQWGGVGKGSHRAGAAHAEAGWTFRPKWHPRLMLEYNFGSGDDDPTDGDNNAFNNLFPTNHGHYGYMDYQNWSNTNNLGLGFSAKPRRGLTLWAKYWRFWLADKRDAWRNAGSAPLGRSISGSAGSDVGSEWDLGITARINRHFGAQLGFSLFEGGRFVRQTRPTRGETSRFFWAQGSVKF